MQISMQISTASVIMPFFSVQPSALSQKTRNAADQKLTAESGSLTAVSS
ncbi:MAG: hypothetical protein IID45_07920 [Planctomycetes bacterium]|nr:hypothetical protein [Planctomycetota bacterium]